MTSINATNPNESTSPFLNKLNGGNRTKFEVPADSVRAKADSFESQIKSRVSGANDPKTAYTIVSRFQEIQNKLTPDSIATQPSKPEPPQAQSSQALPYSTGPTPLRSIDEARAAKSAGETTETGETTEESQIPEQFTFDDLTAARELLGTRTGDENFDARYDMNQDGEINFTDLIAMLPYVNESAAAPE